ncbi:MAG TPA: N-acetylmuramoyl-L-alanine amidase [Nannocystis exedens]|nr:N-acetylmuramoyl-L-alanine amidase [Nannocystis exedens]
MAAPNASYPCRTRKAVAIVAAMIRSVPAAVLAVAALLPGCSRPIDAGNPQEGISSRPAPHVQAADPAQTKNPAPTSHATGTNTSGSSSTSGSSGDKPPTVPPALRERPIRYDDQRQALTLEYRRLHEGGDPQSVIIEPRMVVLHHTGGSSVDSAWRYFNRPTIESGRKTLAKAGNVNVGAQFLVDRDGTILRLMPENWHARHCIGLNHIAIGIENVGDGTQHPLTEAQIKADAALVRYLAQVYPITHVIGHHEANKMRKHPYFHEEVAGYRTRKGDPGPAFIAAVRERISDLNLKGPPTDP